MKYLSRTLDTILSLLWIFQIACARPVASDFAPPWLLCCAAAGGGQSGLRELSKKYSTVRAAKMSKGRGIATGSQSRGWVGVKYCTHGIRFMFQRTSVHDAPRSVVG
ncbi:hypothetical protein BJV74DRAFT_859537 [Russula compacta]|nr:hypothetical protein BJV74DRAFT_859537 [Russula compacta]